MSTESTIVGLAGVGIICSGAGAGSGGVSSPRTDTLILRSEKIQISSPFRGGVVEAERCSTSKVVPGTPGYASDKSEEDADDEGVGCY